MPHFAAGALVVLVVITASCANSDSVAMYGSDSRYGDSRPPAMDPSRKIAEQDCGKAIDPFSGNLRCM